MESREPSSRRLFRVGLSFLDDGVQFRCCDTAILVGIVLLELILVFVAILVFRQDSVAVPVTTLDELLTERLCLRRGGLLLFGILRTVYFRAFRFGCLPR